MNKKSKYILAGISLFIIIIPVCTYVIHTYKSKSDDTLKDLKPAITEPQEMGNQTDETQEAVENDEKRYDVLYYEKYIKANEDNFYSNAKAGEINDKLFEQLFITYIKTADIMNEEVANELDLDDVQDNYYKTSWIKIWAEEGNPYYDLNRQYLAKKYEKYISPAYYEWLNHLDKTAKLTNDAALTITPDELREYIVYLEKFKEKYPDFVDINGVNLILNGYLEIYLMGLDNTRVFIDWENKMNPEFKSSYEKFLSENKDSKYYNMVEELYNKAKENNFKCDNKLIEWHQEVFFQKYLKKEN